MADDTTEVFGSTGQQDVQRRAWALWQLVGDDPAYASHGRAIALTRPTPENVAQQIAMARLVGVGVCERVPTDLLPERVAELRRADLDTDSFVTWASTPASLDLARGRLSTRPLPGDLDLVVVDAHTDASVLSALDEVTQTCEMLLPSGPFIRGIVHDALCVAAVEPSGRVAGAAASVQMFHPGSDLGGTCWWGMLATQPDRRGQGIASYLGAFVLEEMNRRFGYGSFFTGIREDNAPSAALCGGLGFAAKDEHVLIGIDPQVLSGGRITK